MMKKHLFLLVLVVLFIFRVNAQSTDQTSQPTTVEEYRLEATIICLDAIEAPTKYNAFANQFILDDIFPEVVNGQTHEEFQVKINNWLVENPLLVDKILLERKKAHDILYGPHPY